MTRHPNANTDQRAVSDGATQPETPAVGHGGTPRQGPAGRGQGDHGGAPAPAAEIDLKTLEFDMYLPGDEHAVTVPGDMVEAVGLVGEVFPGAELRAYRPGKGARMRVRAQRGNEEVWEEW